jgi:hypothetical protein
VRLLDGSWGVIAGTATHLYRWTLGGWTDVSRTTGGLYNVPGTGELWSFDQFGQNVIAVNINDDPQVLNVDSGSNFAALGGSPPRAHSVKTLGDFLVLTGLSTNMRRLRWSGINDVTQWTVGLNLCDEQEFPDGGPIMGVGGNDTLGYILQDRSIRTMQFLPGDTTFIFSIARVVKDRGCVSEYGFATVSDVLYFVSESGFYALAGSQIAPIGVDWVNQWWMANSDPSRRRLILCNAVNRPYIVWFFHSNSSTQVYDRAIIFNWANRRWSSGTVSAQAWAMLATVPLDLDTTGPEPGDAYLDSPPAPLPPNAPQSLDSFAYTGGRPLTCGIDPNGLLGALNGPNLAAIMQTAEAHLVPGMRAFVSEVYPLCDTGSGTISVETRERLGDAKVTTPDFPLEITGSASVLTSSRLHRFTLKLPFGEPWTNAQGVLAEAQPDGAA